MSLQGGCLCGNVRYSVEGDPGFKCLCHCGDCRKITGSVYSINGLFSHDNFKILKGTPKSYRKVADSGKPITSFFCGDCGCTMWRFAEAFEGMNIVKTGTLDDASALAQKVKPDVELFADSRVPWVAAVDGAEQKGRM